jgi:hypothetical protein
MTYRYGIRLFILATIILFCLVNRLPADASGLDQWKALLHYQGGRSLVKSGEFFLNENGSIDPGAELEKTISLLESPDGITTACRFPARYLWIVDNDLSSSRYDLAKCQDLNQYVSGFPGETVNLVLVSEDIHSPASAFGHMMLSFSDNSRPTDETQFIHFIVERTEESIIIRALKTIFGGHNVPLSKTSLPDVRSHYNVEEQRALNVHRLDLGPEDVRRLLYHLFELKDVEFPYIFSKENCAFYVASLLDIAYEEDRSSYRRWPYVLPVQIVELYNDHIQDTFVLEPSSKKPVPGSPPNIHTALLGIGLARTKTERFGLLRFRAHGKDIRDVKLEGPKGFAFSILDLSLMRDPQGEIVLKNLDIVKVRSIFSRQVQRSGMSWSLYAGRNMENSAQELAWDFRLGLGVGAGNMVMGASVMLEGGIQSDKGDGRSYFVPRGDLQLYLGNSVKTGITVWEKHSSGGEFGHGELFLNWDFGKGFILTTVERSGADPVDSTTVTLHWKL